VEPVPERRVVANGSLEPVSVLLRHLLKHGVAHGLELVRREGFFTDAEAAMQHLGCTDSSQEVVLNIAGRCVAQAQGLCWLPHAATHAPRTSAGWPSQTGETQVKKNRWWSTALPSCLSRAEGAEASEAFWGIAGGAARLISAVLQLL
jgi:hypothetical protein